jgi:hypothetical protein
MRRTDSLKTSARHAGFVAPWTVVPIVALELKGGHHLSRLELFFSGLLVGAFAAVPLTYLAVLLVGYPAYRLLLAYDRLNVWTLVGVGTVVGALCPLAFVGVVGIPLCSSCGFVVAFTAWLIIRRDVLSISSGGQSASPDS